MELLETNQQVIRDISAHSHESLQCRIWSTGTLCLPTAEGSNNNLHEIADTIQIPEGHT